LKIILGCATNGENNGFFQILTFAKISAPKKFSEERKLYFILPKEKEKKCCTGKS
jgi:hypothetical protein